MHRSVHDHVLAERGHRGVGILAVLGSLPRPSRRQLQWAGPRLFALWAGGLWWAAAVAATAAAAVAGRAVFGGRWLVVLVVAGYAQILWGSLAYLLPVLRPGRHDPRHSPEPRSHMTAFLLPPTPITSLDEYLATDMGGVGVATAQRLGPRATIETVAAAGLRGRGGGGFPTGRKWAGIAGQAGSRRYLVCNGAEGEPGTFKDRALLRANPYQVVEGLIIAAFAIGADEAFICLKAGFEREIAAATRAVQEFQAAGICADCTVNIVAGPDEYLFGEEKAMLEVIEGKPPLPRWFPPYEHGLFAASPQEGWEAGPHGMHRRSDEPNPTLVNNVETLANVPHILARGADWFRASGTVESPGTVIATVVGDVVAPDVGEVELGTPLGAVIDAVGSGVSDGRTVKAVFSGVANPVITAARLDTPVSYEGFAAIGSGMGAAGFIVHDDTACMVDAAYRFSRFLSIESCGQCPPCKMGSGEITRRLERIETGVGDDRDIEVIHHWLERVTDGNRCFLAVEEKLVVSSVLRAFPEEFAEHIEQHACPRPTRRPIPKLLDLDGGVATYDEAFWRKQPDWTYEPG